MASTAAIVTAALVQSDVAQAQTTPATNTADAGPIEEVVVTGSRLVISGFTAPTPVTMLSEKDFENQAPANIGDIITRLPSFRASSGPQIGGVTSRGGGQYFADLRGLGSSRTLVLLDGKRYVPSGLTSTVDLNQIPNILVERADVVTGGASAAYGADAVAGVLNLILKKDIEGVEGDAQWGTSERGDARSWKVSLATGAHFANDKGHFVIGGDFNNESGAPDQYSRAWGRLEYNTITNTAFATNGLANYIISPNVHNATLYNGGIVTSGPLKGTAFGPGGAPFQYTYGQVFGSFMIGGDGYGQTLSEGSNLASPLWRGNVLAHADYDVSDAFSLNTELSYARSRVKGVSQQPRDASITIPIDNAYLPATTKAQMQALKLTSIAIGRLHDDYGYTPLQNNTETYRVVVGAKGDLPDGWYGEKWRYDAYYQYGHNFYHTFIFHDRITANWNQAIDAVVSPANGQIVCRSTLTNPSNGCRPVDLFGNGAITANDVAYLGGTQEYLLYTNETVYSAQLQGEPTTTWAGPLSIVFGGEYRIERGNAASDPISRQVQPNGTVGGFLLGNPQPFFGKYHVSEFFGETVVPLAKDVPWAKSLDLNAAIRRTDYSTSGDVVTWKVGLTWEPTDEFRLRGTRSRDIRAPTLSDLFSPEQLSGFTNVLNNLTGLSPQTARHSAGNPNLVPEVADTWTGGIVVLPRWLSGLSVSLDYYSVDIQKAIASIDQATVATQCYAGFTAYCQYIHRDSTGNIIYVLGPTLNLFSSYTNGLDLEASYNFGLDQLGKDWNGTVGLRLLGTYVFHLISTDITGPHDRVGQMSTNSGTSGVPHLSWTGDITYTLNKFSADLNMRFVGSGVFNTDYHTGTGAANTINNNHVPSRAYLGLSASYNLLDPQDKRRVQLYAMVSNLLDKDPPMVPANGAGGANATSSNPAFYDVIGRSYKIGTRFKF